MPTAHDLLRIARLLDATAVSAHDFFVSDTSAIGGSTRADSPRRFGLAVHEAIFDDVEMSAAAIPGHAPAAVLNAFAFGKSRIDHYILGELALFLAREFRGYVNFRGDLGDALPSEGRMIAVPYDAQNVLHIADSIFLESWLEHPEFHMIK